MPNENDLELQQEMDQLLQDTCGSWENCTEENIKSFLEKCQDINIDPYYCLEYIKQHKEQIHDWTSVEKTSLNWANDHTSTGNPVETDEGNPLQ